MSGGYNPATGETLQTCTIFARTAFFGCFIIVVLGCAAATTVTAQNPAAPIAPPPPTDAQIGNSSPTLPVTMAFVAKKLAEQTSIEYWILPSGPQEQWGEHGYQVLTSEVRLDDAKCERFNTCFVHYHQRWAQQSTDGSYRYKPSEGTYGFSINEMIRIQVMDATEYLVSIGTDESLIEHVRPSFFTLAVFLPKGGRADFFFYSREEAQRVEKALSHAMELVGKGKENEPF